MKGTNGNNGLHTDRKGAKVYSFLTKRKTLLEESSERRQEKARDPLSKSINRLTAKINTFQAQNNLIWGKPLHGANTHRAKDLAFRQRSVNRGT